MIQHKQLLSLCTGYGGLDLAVEAFLDCELVACAEIDKYASLAIDKHFGVPNLGDIKQLDWASLGEIDIITAGYPCQPFSHAGQRKGTEDERHIWPHIKEGIGILRPSLVILENVRGHLSLGFKEVLQDLASIGYDAIWTVVRASDVGAPHQRARLFIIAYPDSYAFTQSRRANRNIRGETSEIQHGSDWQKHGCSFTNTSNANAKQLSTDRQAPQLGWRFETPFEMQLRQIPTPLVDGKLNTKFVEYMMGLPEGWVTGLPISRAQQFKMLGNGVVPQQAFYALETLWKMRHAV